MTRFPQGEKPRGSQHWIQVLVNEFPDVLNAAIGHEVNWCSPLRDDDYSEYRDQQALDLLGLRLEQRLLAFFWPGRGPQWDALGKAGVAPVLVEAKSHIGELFSPATQAGEESAARIREALDEVKQGLRARPGLDWCSRFYQYANRLAHGYLLDALNSVHTHLVFLYFIGDGEMNGPTTRAEWEAAIRVMHEALGLSRTPAGFIVEAFIDVREAFPRVS